MNETLRVGLIQPVINPEIAWGEKAPYSLNISAINAERIWQEIKQGLAALLKNDEKPSIILIPELHLPTNKVRLIKSISKSYGVMIIAGMDFQRNPHNTLKIRNRGIVTFPANWTTKLKSTRLTSLFFGKSYFTYMERAMFKNIESEICEEDSEQNMYIFHSREYGNFGLMICSDIFDIERMMFYQGRIHHLLIISLNKDLTTYFSMAESLTRLLYCNVVICNTGFFGGSMAVSPYSSAVDRIIYKYQGQKMFNTHVVDLPVLSLDLAQRFNFATGDKNKDNIKFKASPPGYRKLD